MKITPTSLLTTGYQAILMVATGLFMLLNVAVIGFYTLDGISNYRKMQDANITHTVQLHKFLSDEFETNPMGVQRHCVAITEGGRASIRELPNSSKTIPAGDFCKQMMSNAVNWKKHVPPHDTPVIENLFWSVIFLIVFMTAAYLVTSIPASFVGLLIPGLIPYTRVIALALTLPVLLFWGVFVKAAWTYEPSYWLYHGHVVETHKVFMNDKGEMYIAPNSLFGWSNSDTMMNLTIKD